MGTRNSNKMQNLAHHPPRFLQCIVPFGVTYEKIGTIQRRLAWPLHKDDTLSRSGRSTDLNIHFYFTPSWLFSLFLLQLALKPYLGISAAVTHDIFEVPQLWLLI